MDPWIEETFKDLVRLGLRGRRSLLHARSRYQTIDIVDTEPYGVTLLLDGAMMTSVGEEHFYHEMLVHPALTVASSIRRILVVGGGDGGTAREALRYRDVEQVILCEIDVMVTEACRAHMTEMRVPWDDPRLTLLFADGIDYVRGPGEPFDVILIDGSDPVGPAEGLFTTAFYESCKSRLVPEGVLTVQSEAPFLMREDFVSVVRNLRSVFPQVHPYFGPAPIYPSGSWSYTLAASTVDPVVPRPERLAQIESACRYYNRDIHRAAFAQPNDVRRALARPD